MIIYMAGHGTLDFHLIYDHTKYRLYSYHYTSDVVKNFKILRELQKNVKST